jgi:hypothetical protein
VVGVEIATGEGWDWGLESDGSGVTLGIDGAP